MNGPLDIGVLDEAEHGAAVTLWNEAGLTRPWNDPRRDLALAMGEATSTVLVGRVEGRLVATVMVGFDGHRGWVYYLAVAADQRKRGYAWALMQAAEAWLAERGAPRLNLMVRASNAGVLAFYEGQGYRRSDVVVLQRDLG